ncbi:MAG: diaminopimelate decarboxylase [Actinobacteria bacterium]|nr:MAG: diaminopimelate decarboxylase [Actinomycetota bacterium]TMM27414.1 MAG: diaminopimelate decarboxylase [Actinomycetota bacterium]
MIAGQGAGERCRSGHRLATIAAEVGTPFYAYDLDRFRERIRAFEAGLPDVPHLTCYAVKANDALALLAIVAAEGLGADVVSGGELAKCGKAGITPASIVFSGVGKRDDEIRAAVEAEIRSVNVESLEELDEVSAAARQLGRVAPISVRVNPDVAGGGHEYLATGGAASKFGLERADAREAFRRAATDDALDPVGLSFHVGSQLLDTEPVLMAAERAAELWRELADAGIRLRDFDAGGGLGIAYDGGAEPDVQAYTARLAELAGSVEATLILEPGRHLVGPAGTFVTRVLHVKRAGGRTIAVCDGGSNDLLRPALYGAEHPITVLVERERERALVDLVGPLCESSDFLALDRTLPLPRRGDLIAVELAGAYGRVMSSTYNARPLCAEVVLEQGSWRVSRERGTYDDLIRNERP